MTQLTLKHVGVTLHKRPLLTDISLTWPAAQVSGIIGPNGAGKSTYSKPLTTWSPLPGRSNINSAH